MYKKMVVKAITNKFENGQALIEIILAIAIAAIFLPSVIFTMIGVREGFSRTEKSLEANLLLQKEIEAIRSIKDSAWNSLTNGSTFHTQLNVDGTWSAVPGTTVNNGLTRSFTVTEGCRISPTSVMTVPPCTGLNKIDPSTKKISATVSWNSLGTRSLSTSFYITRFFGNKSWIQTTQADFNTTGRVITNTTLTPTGEVEIAPIASPNWKTPANPVLRDVTATNIDANDIFIVGNRAYVVTNNRTGIGALGYEFLVYDITTPSNPGAAPIGGADLGANAYSVVVSGNYAYIANGNNARELAIVNLTSFITSGYDTPSNAADGRGVAVVAATNRAYLATDNNGSGSEFYILNIANPASPALAPGTNQLNLGSDTRDIFVSGNYAYIASTSNTQELQIVNVNSPVTPSVAGGTIYDIPSNTLDSLSVYVVGNTVYLANGSTLYSLNVSSLPPSLIITFSAGGIINTVFASGTLAFIGTSNTSQEFQIVNYCTANQPVLQGFRNLGTLASGDNVNGVYVLGSYAFLATATNNGEFTVLQGGPAYQSAGALTFESYPFNANSSVGFNSLHWVSNPIIQNCTSTRLQIATSNNGSVWSSYVGPTGAASFYTSPGAIPLDNILAQFIKYRITFTGNGHNTPSVQEVSVNYSP